MKRKDLTVVSLKLLEDKKMYNSIALFKNLHKRGSIECPESENYLIQFLSIIKDLNPIINKLKATESTKGCLNQYGAEILWDKI